MTDIVERLRAWCTDWDGSQMVDGEPPLDGLHCDTLREAADTIEAQAAEIERLRETLIRISCPSQTDGLLWWQIDARAALGKDKP